jgi:hypothetical protein
VEEPMVPPPPMTMMEVFARETAMSNANARLL